MASPSFGLTISIAIARCGAPPCSPAHVFRRERLGDAGPCEVDADEYTPLEHLAPVHRDPVDVGRQPEILVQLFRAGEMPRDGVDILEGVASRCTYEEIARDLEISTDTVEGRMRRMRDKFHTCMAKRRMLPGMLPLHVLVSTPAAIERLRKAA